MRLINIKTLSRAIRNSLEKEMDEKTADGIAICILDFFGFGDRICDNILINEERDVFNILEQIGLLSTYSEEITLFNGKNWRIYYWILNIETIFKKSRLKKKEEKNRVFENIYDNVPDDIWERD